MSETHGLQSLKYLVSGPLQKKMTDLCSLCPGPGLAVQASPAGMLFRLWEEDLFSEGDGGV